MTKQDQIRPTWAEINLENLIYNFNSAKSFVGGNIQYMAVIKADAYGHGAVECAKKLEAQVDWFGVAILEEGLELRKAGIEKPILCLGGFWFGQEKLLLENNITPVIYQAEKLESLDRIAGQNEIKASIHIKIDTGMGRIGVRYDQVEEFISHLKCFDNLHVEGLMTHFASADNLSENQFTNEQIKRFEQSVAVFEENGFRPLYKDLANSSGAVAHPDSRANLVRLGGILYGLSDDVLPKEAPKPVLKPVMSLHSRIAHLKKVPKGESLGYSRTFFTHRDSLIATIPIGYEDGLPRNLSNLGKIIVNGNFAPIVARISMDWTIVDVTDVPDVKIDDEVIFIGEQNDLKITAEELAREAETISYEITCGINRRVARKYIGSQEKPPF